MPLRKCACIDTLYTEQPFLDRFAAAKQDGFESVEFWDVRRHRLDDIREAAQTAGIRIHGFNGDGDYSMIDPAQQDRYLKSLREAVDAALLVGAESLTIHSNALGEGGVVQNHHPELSDTVKLCSMYEVLQQCKKIAEQTGIRMSLEALNVVTDHVGNFLQTTQMAAELCRMVNSPSIKLLFDAYHMQLNTGNLCGNLAQYRDQLGHIHVADAPGRHEPGTGEIHYPHLFKQLEQLGYTGRVGFELFPKHDTKTAVTAIMTLS